MLLLRASGLATGPFTVTSGFSHGPPAPSQYTIEHLGPCQLFSRIVPTPTAPARQADSAGVLTLQGSAGAQVILQPAASGKYPSADFTPTTGDTVTLGASGATIPAFTLSLTLPTPVQITSPPAAPGMPLTLDRSVDLAITHNVNATGFFFFQVQQGATSTAPFVSLYCAFPATDATSTVPVGALARLNTDAAGATSTAFFGFSSGVSTHAGASSVGLSVNDYFAASKTLVP